MTVPSNEFCLSNLMEQLFQLRLVMEMCARSILLGLDELFKLESQNGYLNQTFTVVYKSGKALMYYIYKEICGSAHQQLKNWKEGFFRG